MTTSCYRFGGVGLNQVSQQNKEVHSQLTERELSILRFAVERRIFFLHELTKVMRLHCEELCSKQSLVLTSLSLKANTELSSALVVVVTHCVSLKIGVENNFRQPKYSL